MPSWNNGFARRQQGKLYERDVDNPPKPLICPNVEPFLHESSLSLRPQLPLVPFGDLFCVDSKGLCGLCEAV